MRKNPTYYWERIRYIIRKKEDKKELEEKEKEKDVKKRAYSICAKCQIHMPKFSITWNTAANSQVIYLFHMGITMYLSIMSPLFYKSIFYNQTSRQIKWKQSTNTPK